MKRISLLLLAFTLTGCVAFPSYVAPRADNSVSEISLRERGKGAVVFSMTAGMEAGGEQVNPLLRYKATDGSYSDWFTLHGAQLLGPFGQERHFQIVNGKLKILELAPGEYVFTTWGLDNSTGVHYYPKYPLEPLRFEVTVGEVKYLGTFHYELNTGKNMFGMNITAGAWVTIHDQSERDLGVAHKMFPMVKEFRGQILDREAWTIERVSRNVNTIDESQ